MPRRGGKRCAPPGVRRSATSPRIVAIGGGELRGLKTLPIDRRIVSLAGKRKPQALLIPTASGDAAKYIDTFERVYGGKLGCTTRVLTLLRQRPSYDEMAARVLGSDLIYVGGGNTLRMMKLWRRVGLDVLLRRAASRGVVLSGVSAGAICWFRWGHSDSRSFSGRKDWDYIRVTGLGLVDALFCPHYHGEKREASLSQMVARYGGLAIACDNHAAIEIVGDRYRILVSSGRARAYRLLEHQGAVVREPLRPTRQRRPLQRLLQQRPSEAR